MKALVIGLDGATLRVLEPLMAGGQLPHLQAALARGVYGELRSTTPPITALAWPSFMTGCNPGKHGLLSWQGPLNSEFERPWASGAQIDGVKLWQVAGAAGLRVCVYNVPVTYPPEPVQGVMVTGLLTPGIESPFTYPPSLREELLAAFPTYQIDIDTQHTERNPDDLEQMARFLQENAQATQVRGEALRWLLAREPYDLVVAVFEMPDRLQHLLWGPIAALPAAEPGRTGAERLQAGLLRCFKALDDEIGALTAQLPADGYLAFLSDHGFGPINTMVHLNHWLAQAGWLAFDRQRAGSRELLRRVGRVLKRFLPNGWMRRARASFSILQTLDWSQTVAYAGLPSEYGIFINLQGREPAGTVAPAEYEALRSAIMAKLLAWEDPRSGQRIVVAAHRREDLYTGPYVARAPDIIIEFLPGYHIAYLPYQGDILMDVQAQPWGFHEPAGFFGFSGPGILPTSEPQQGRIEDIMPTLLYALGLPLAAELDGRARTGWFGAAWQEAHPLQQAPPLAASAAAAPGAPAAVYSGLESEQLAKRLRDLGYLN
jgi:predicted AlkP superfamily phosphohydrolase/phosphomutase